MTSHDKERIHRWITQADLERMLDDAYAKGAEAMRGAAINASVDRAQYWTETSAAEGGITTMEDRATEARFIADDIRDLPAFNKRPA